MIREGEIVLENRENVILFPKWKTILEKESLLALEQSKYELALEKLNKLISFEVTDHEIVFGKLICLMELERYEEAQDLSEQLLLDSNENYYHYVHVYLTILFQTSQYDSLMAQIEQEFLNNNIPEPIKEQFKQLYDMSKQMKQDIVNKESIEFINNLYTAIANDDYVTQWRLVENLRKMRVHPPEEITDFLLDEQVHPVIKTVLFKWLQDADINKEIEVHKFNKQITVNPLECLTIRDHTITKQTLLLISELEQKNPSLYILLTQLLYRYIYVRYPAVPRSKEVIDIAEALMIIGKRYMHSDTDTYKEQIESYIEEIQMCERLYLSIIEE